MKMGILGTTMNIKKGQDMIRQNQNEPNGDTFYQNTQKIYEVSTNEKMDQTIL